MDSKWQSSMEAVIDKAFDKRVLERDVPGIGISAVHAGQIYSTGYSFADRENRRVVDPARSIFRAGTLSHLLTTIAILQLYERGRLDLNEDVNHFLSRFHVTNTGGGLTVAHLLAHTDGFEERIRSVYAPGIADLSDTASVLADGLRAPIMPPGSTITYGSWGMALAGYIVEQIAEMPFAKFVEENIFQPMGMSNSSFEPLLPEDKANRLLKTYYEDGRSLVPMPILYSTLPSTDGLSTTVNDVAYLMLMLLQRGSYQETRILLETTVEEMLCLRHNHHPALPGSTYGFMEFREHGKSGLVCDGVGMGIRCRLFLIPSDDAAVFVIANSSSGNFCELLTSAYIQHFYPSDAPPPKPPSNFNFRADRFTGTYHYVQHERRSITQLDSLRQSIVSISNNGDGSLKITPLGPDQGRGGFDKAVRLLMVEEPVVFEREDTGARIAFGESRDGLITHLYAGSGQLAAYKKMALLDTPRVILALFALTLLVFVSGVVVWGGYALTTSPQLGEGSAYAAGLFGAALSGMELIFGIGSIAVVTQRKGGLPVYAFVAKVPRLVRWLFNLGLFNILLTFVVALCALLALQFEFWDWPLRGHYLLLTGAALVFVWLQTKLNLFGGGFTTRKLQS